MAKYPLSLLQLMSLLKKFPGVGSKTAERFAFHLLNWKEEHLSQLGELLQTLKEKISHCPTCYALLEEKTCAFCEDSRRDKTLLCVVSSPKDIYAFEDTKNFRGLYHVLGGLLSPLDGREAKHLNVSPLLDRIAILQVQEVILALDSTVEGDATALYLNELLQKKGISVSRLALGLPMGSSLEYVDGGTLARALLGRQSF